MHKGVLTVVSVASTASALFHDVHFWTDAYGYCKPVRSLIARKPPHPCPVLCPRSIQPLTRSRVTASLFIGLTA